MVQQAGLGWRLNNQSMRPETVGDTHVRESRSSRKCLILLEVTRMQWQFSARVMGWRGVVCHVSNSHKPWAKPVISGPGRISYYFWSQISRKQSCNLTDDLILGPKRCMTFKKQFRVWRNYGKTFITSIIRCVPLILHRCIESIHWSIQIRCAMNNVVLFTGNINPLTTRESSPPHNNPFLAQGTI